MKKITVLAALAVISACSQSEPAPEPEATTEAAAAEEIMGADGGPPYGNFRVTRADGTVMMEEVRADGTWTATAPDGTVTNGTWVQKPGEYCTTGDAEDAEEECFAETIDENGVWVSTDPSDGSISTVERLDDAATAE